MNRTKYSTARRSSEFIPISLRSSSSFFFFYLSSPTGARGDLPRDANDLSPGPRRKSYISDGQCAGWALPDTRVRRETRDRACARLYRYWLRLLGRYIRRPPVCTMLTNDYDDDRCFRFCAFRYYNVTVEWRVRTVAVHFFFPSSTPAVRIIIIPADIAV